MSAFFNSPDIWIIFTILCLIIYPSNWCLSSINFWRFVPYGLPIIRQVAWFAVRGRPGPTATMFESVNSRSMTCIWCAPVARTMYYNSAVDIAMRGRFSLTQYMGTLLYVITSHVVDLRSVWSPPKLASAYSCRSAMMGGHVGFNLNLMPLLGVWIRYRSVAFTVPKWRSVGDWVAYTRSSLKYDRLGHVKPTRYLKSPTNWW